MMKKIKALIFRELRISRKVNILNSVIFLLYALIFLSGIISIVSMENELETAHVDLIIFSCSILSGILSVLLNLQQDYIIINDLNSNHAAYLYVLPIKPEERALTNVIKKYTLTTIYMITGLVFIVIYCNVGNEKFSSSYITIYAAILAFIQLAMVIYDNFIYGAKSIEEYKKQRILISVLSGNFIGIVVSVFCLFKDKIIKHLISMDIFSIDKLFEIMDLKLLFVIIPINILLIIADYFIIKNRLKLAYSVSYSKTKIETSSNKDIFKRHNYLKGFLYKELRQNRFIILLTSISPLIILAVIFLMQFMLRYENKSEFRVFMISDDSTFIRYLCIATGAFIASNLICNIFSGDNNKLWAYFTISTPQCAKDSIYYKYYLSFALNGVYLIFSLLANYIYDTIYFSATGEKNISINLLSVIIFFILLLICAVDIPLIIRFGQKKGSYIKVTAMLSVSIIAILTFVNLPENVIDNIIKFCINIFRNGMNNTILLIICILLILCFAVYFLSYKFSCKLFRDNAENSNQ